MPDDLMRRQMIAESIARHGTPVVVPVDRIPIGETLQTWEPGLPFVLGAVMRLGDWWYMCDEASAPLAAAEAAKIQTNDKDPQESA